MFGISLMYNVNNSGPRTDSWGALLVTGHQLEEEPFKITLW